MADPAAAAQELLRLVPEVVVTLGAAGCLYAAPRRPAGDRAGPAGAGGGHDRRRGHVRGCAGGGARGGQAAYRRPCPGRARRRPWRCSGRARRPRCRTARRSTPCEAAGGGRAACDGAAAGARGPAAAPYGARPVSLRLLLLAGRVPGTARGGAVPAASASFASSASSPPSAVAPPASPAGASAPGSTTFSRPGRTRADTTMYVTASRNTSSAVHTLRRRPRMWWASSMRMYSIQARPTQYAATYSAKARPWPRVKRRSARTTSSATPTHHSDSRTGRSGGRGPPPGSRPRRSPAPTAGRSACRTAPG